MSVSEVGTSMNSSMAEPVGGYCAVTEGGGSCSHGRSGSWSNAVSLSACAARCASCSRCRFVSFSAALSDCSWYAACQLTRLQQTPSGFTTLHVPAGRLPVPPDPPWRQVPPAHGAPRDAKRGYCSTTLYAGDCMLGDAGTMEGVPDLLTCRQRCLECPRCAVISWSLQRRDCSWYALCAINDLRRPPRDAPDYLSMRVRDAPATLPPPPSQQPRSGVPTGRPLSMAIATLAAAMPRHKRARGNGAKGTGEADGGDDSPGAIGCALVLWCERADRLRRALHSGLGWNVTLVLVGASAAAAAHCPRAHTRRLAVDEPLMQALRASSIEHGARCAAATDVNMLKLSVIGCVEFDLVLFSDVDINLMPANDLKPAMARWGKMAPRLHAERAIRFVANADAMSPVNGGLWLVKPSRPTLNAMLRALRRCRWNVSHGWDLVGPPQSLGLSPRHPDGQAVSTDVGDVPERSDAYRRNDWSFVNGGTDQGFLWFWFYVRRDQGRYFRYGGNQGHHVLHWRAWPKPWAVGWNGGFRAALIGDGASTGGAASGAARGTTGGTAKIAGDVRGISPWELSYAYTYLRDLYVPDGVHAAVAGTCVRELWAFRRAIEDDERFDDLPPTRLGSSVPYFALW